ncbi:unnamed protein product [Rhizoctonia solani]|uniref:Transmembrane protein n=1 Tax=Rhizoctonia solani TaxID=456999 RepID=A0A8H2XVS3_9AGAM|nr:unnamed protein product [Rhizoctonia solani]
MTQKPALKDETGHPYPNGHWWLYFTIVLFVLALPALVIFNLITQGSELVPSLQPIFRSDGATPPDTWWGKRLPPQLSPGLPPCEPQGLGRGDVFRLTASLFDYKVMSTWNTTKGNAQMTAGKQEQERVEYRGESFADCFVNTARYDYSLGEQTHSVTVGVFCPGYSEYPIQVSMQTTMAFAWEVTKDFIGQYYGPGLDLMNLTDTTGFQQTVLAVLEVISTDALTILHKPHLSAHPLSMRVFFELNETAIVPDQAAASTLTYVNGTQPDQFPEEAFIYINSVYNLVYAAVDAVNLDIGNRRSPNMFRDASRLRQVISPNQAPPGINASNWAEGSRSIYYGMLTEGRETWADMLLNGLPANITLGNPTGLPDESAMVTTYLCPVYVVKPLKSLLASVFIGSAAMSSSAWSAWLLFVALLAKGQMEPRAQCECSHCQERRRDEAVRPGIIARLREIMGLKSANNTSNRDGVDTSHLSETLQPVGRKVPEKQESYLSGATVV